MLEFVPNSRVQLEKELTQLQEALAQLDAWEPENEESEAYEDWAEEHEDLEDSIDEILEILDALRD